MQQLLRKPPAVRCTLAGHIDQACCLGTLLLRKQFGAQFHYRSSSNEEPCICVFSFACLRVYSCVLLVCPPPNPLLQRESDVQRGPGQSDGKQDLWGWIGDMLFTCLARAKPFHHLQECRVMKPWAACMTMTQS